MTNVPLSHHRQHFHHRFNVVVIIIVRVLMFIFVFVVFFYLLLLLLLLLCAIFNTIVPTEGDTLTCAFSIYSLVLL